MPWPRAKLLAFLKEQRAQRKLAGVCPRCGGDLGEKTCGCCATCQEKSKKCLRKRTSKRVQSGACIRCGKDSNLLTVRKSNGVNVWCQDCYFKETTFSALGSIKEWKKVREMFYSQNEKCYYSGRPMILGVNSEIDHKIPRARGGTKTLDNICWALESVNAMKTDTTEEEFVALCTKVVNYASK